jgi:hypothetical protein
MTDHGSMQDRIFLRAILVSLWGDRLTTTDTRHKADVGKVNNELKCVVDGIASLATQSTESLSTYVNRFALSTWWLSIDQLYFLCDDAGTLRDALSRLGCTNFGTGDLMNEIAHYDRLKRGA